MPSYTIQAEYWLRGKSYNEKVHNNTRSRPWRRRIYCNGSCVTGCITQGETIEQCIERAQEAIAGYIESLKAEGEPILEETERPQMITIDVAA